jgi:hypothetical protein
MIWMKGQFYSLHTGYNRLDHFADFRAVMRMRAIAFPDGISRPGGVWERQFLAANIAACSTTIAFVGAPARMGEGVQRSCYWRL